MRYLLFVLLIGSLGTARAAEPSIAKVIAVGSGGGIGIDGVMQPARATHSATTARRRAFTPAFYANSDPPSPRNPVHQLPGPPCQPHWQIATAVGPPAA